MSPATLPTLTCGFPLNPFFMLVTLESCPQDRARSTRSYLIVCSNQDSG